jgi:hypothetical protein
MTTFGTDNSPDEQPLVNVIIANTVRDRLVGLVHVVKQKIAKLTPNFFGTWNDGDPKTVTGFVIRNADGALEVLRVVNVVHTYLITEDDNFAAICQLPFKSSVDTVHDLCHQMMGVATTKRPRDISGTCLVPYLSDFPTADALDDLILIVDWIIAQPD